MAYDDFENTIINSRNPADSLYSLYDSVKSVSVDKLSHPTIQEHLTFLQLYLNKRLSVEISPVYLFFRTTLFLIFIKMSESNLFDEDVSFYKQVKLRYRLWLTAAMRIPEFDRYLMNKLFSVLDKSYFTPPLFIAAKAEKVSKKIADLLSELDAQEIKLFVSNWDMKGGWIKKWSDQSAKKAKINFSHAESAIYSMHHAHGHMHCSPEIPLQPEAVVCLLALVDLEHLRAVNKLTENTYNTLYPAVSQADFCKDCIPILWNQLFSLNYLYRDLYSEDFKPIVSATNLPLEKNFKYYQHWCHYVSALETVKLEVTNIVQCLMKLASKLSAPKSQVSKILAALENLAKEVKTLAEKTMAGRAIAAQDLVNYYNAFVFHFLPTEITLNQYYQLKQFQEVLNDLAGETYFPSHHLSGLFGAQHNYESASQAVRMLCEALELKYGYKHKCPDQRSLNQFSLMLSIIRVANLQSSMLGTCAVLEQCSTKFKQSQQPYQQLALLHEALVNLLGDCYTPIKNLNLHIFESKLFQLELREYIWQ